MGIGGDRNKRRMWYALYEGISDVRDSQGRRTGAKQTTYTAPAELMANISPASGGSDPSPFGTVVNFDRTVLVFDTNLAIDENSILWIDRVPVIKNDGTTDTPHDYVVTGIAKGLLSISYAVKRVEVR